MKQLLLFLFSPFLLLACSGVEEADIESLMAAQEKTWNAGDIEGFMQPYWKNDSLLFIGKSGITYGWQTVLDNYKKSYLDANAMGKLHFEIVQKNSLSRDYCQVIGKWTLERNNDRPSGHFTLIWKKIDGEWKIINDHSS
jgi:hypothetical protein